LNGKRFGKKDRNPMIEMIRIELDLNDSQVDKLNALSDTTGFRCDECPGEPAPFIPELLDILGESKTWNLIFWNKSFMYPVTEADGDLLIDSNSLKNQKINFTKDFNNFVSKISIDANLSQIEKITFSRAFLDYKKRISAIEVEVYKRLMNRYIRTETGYPENQRFWESRWSDLLLDYQLYKYRSAKSYLYHALNANLPSERAIAILQALHWSVGN
jgi:hypothetical protein